MLLNTKDSGVYRTNFFVYNFFSFEWTVKSGFIVGGMEQQEGAEQREKPAQIFLEAFCPVGVEDIWPKTQIHKFGVVGKIKSFTWARTNEASTALSELLIWSMLQKWKTKAEWISSGKHNKEKKEQEWQRMVLVTERQQKSGRAGGSSSRNGRLAPVNNSNVYEAKNFVSKTYFLTISPWTQLFFMEAYWDREEED